MKTRLYCYAKPGRYGADHIFSLQNKTVQTAINIVGVDEAIPFRWEHIDNKFKQENEHILSQNRGAGYWLWKPYFALKLMESSHIDNNDIIVYSDSKLEFTKSIKPLIDVFLRDNLSVMTFRQLTPSKPWTKRDCFILTNSDEPKYTETTQRVGGFFIFKKNEFAYNFFKETLNYHRDHRISTDSPNECGYPNYEGFIEHRHDESLISIMSKKYDLYPYRIPFSNMATRDQRITNNQFTKESFEKFKQENPNESFFTTFLQYPNIVTDEMSTYDNIINY